MDHAVNAYELCVSYQNLDNYIYYGLLDPLVSVFGINSAIVLPLGMLMGILATGFIALRTKKSDRETQFGCVALASMCWMYVQPSDIVLLGLLSFAAATAVLFKGANGKLFYLLSCGALLTALPLTGTVYMISFLVPLVMRMLWIIAAVNMLCAMESGKLQPWRSIRFGQTN